MPDVLRYADHGWMILGTEHTPPKWAVFQVEFGKGHTLWFSDKTTAYSVLVWKREWEVQRPARWRVWLYKLRRALPWR